MSIVQDERNNITQIENNTAQTELEDYILPLNSSITELNIQSSLQGDLDLSVLKDKFKKLQSIVFGRGKITDIRNVPEGVFKMVCSNNLLINLEELPGSLLYLDIEGNYFETFDFKNTPHLEELHCSNNKLENFENIPEALTVLYCDYNNFQHLDLKGLSNLKILHCSHNPLLAVENIPENIHEFVAEGTPFSLEKTIDYDVDDDDEDTDASKSDAQARPVGGAGGEQKKKIGYADALNSYFKMKSKYDTQNLEQKRKKYKEIFVKTGSKNSGARAAFNVKGSCIHCKRKVGTKFYTNKEGYYAICGDKQDPCQLDIKLFRGNFFVNEYYMYLYKDQMEKEKEDIIKHKLDTLFGHISEEQSVKLFKTKLESFNLTSELYNEVVKRNNELYNNPQKKEDIQKKQKQTYEISDQIQSVLNEYYKDDTNKEILRTAVNMYIRDLLPETENLRRLKYDTVEVTEDTLVQREVNISKIEFQYGEHPTVERFRGV
jgi:hypothetical protein